MFRVLGLIVVLMIMSFSLVVNLTADATGGKKVNPVKSITSGVTDVLNSADEIAPGIARAIDKVEVPTPKLTGLSPKNDKNKNEQKFVRPVLSAQDLTGIEAAKRNYAGAALEKTIFLTAGLDDATFEGAAGKESVFRKARMARANLTAASFTGADFTGVDLKGAAARAGKFDGSDFSEADLTSAAFSGASLKKSIMIGAFASNAQFVDTQAPNALFNGADLRGANFSYANLSGASFHEADISLANFNGAKLKGADLTQTIGLAEARLDGACGDGDTKMPEGFILPSC